MTGQTYRSVGVRRPEIVAVSATPDGLDDLAGTDTAAIDAGDLTVLQASADWHEHLMQASATSCWCRRTGLPAGVIPGGRQGAVHAPGQLIVLQELSLTHVSTFHARQRGITGRGCG